MRLCDEARMHLKLISPERVLSDEPFVSVSVPTELGEITVLPHHAPLVAILVSGIITVRLPNGSIDEIAVSNGFIRVTKEGVTILAETAERGHELDVSVIEEAKTRAKQVMVKAATQDDVAFAMAAAALEREMARYKLAVKKRTGKGNRLSQM